MKKISCNNYFFHTLTGGNQHAYTETEVYIYKHSFFKYIDPYALIYLNRKHFLKALNSEYILLCVKVILVFSQKIFISQNYS